MSELKGGHGEFRATIHVKRKATGKTDTYELVMRPETPSPKHHGSSGGLAGEGANLSNAAGDKE